jgi:hypothetical protein
VECLDTALLFESADCPLCEVVRKGMGVKIYDGAHFGKVTSS